MSQLPLRIAIAGIGGFGSAHHQNLLSLEENGVCKVVATCDPKAAELEAIQQKYRFAERGVAVYTDFTAMLDAHQGGFDLVTLATPIGLHAPMHRACVERGLACYLEKPPTLDPEELEAMIRTDNEAAQAGRATQVGYNYIYLPHRQELKRRILAGEFGRLQRVSFYGMWPRSRSYYTRNNWAGRLLLGDTILLDSCCGNAMSHHLHNILFFGGLEGQHCWGHPRAVEAELYRANPIEGTDTVFARGELENGVEFRIAAGHPCDQPSSSTLEILTCEEAEIEIDSGARTLKIRHRNGRLEESEAAPPILKENFALYGRYLGGKEERPPTLLSDCRGFVALNALLYLATDGIATVPAPHAAEIPVPGNDGDRVYVIHGLCDIGRRMIDTGEFPSEQGCVAWARPGGRATADALGELRPKLLQLSGK